MRRKKEDFVVIGFAVVLLIIIFIIVVVLTTSSQTPNVQQKGITPVPVTTAAPTPTIPPYNGKPTVLYDSAAQDKLINSIKERKSLSQSDMVAKATILAQLPAGQQSGILYTTPLMQIEYIHSADLFQVEILTTDLKSAKNAANVWFRARGISQEAICTLPVEFYLNYDIAKQLRQTNIIFSPLGNGC
jgi:hypothetical protein